MNAGEHLARLERIAQAAETHGEVLAGRADEGYTLTEESITGRRAQIAAAQVRATIEVAKALTDLAMRGESER